MLSRQSLTPELIPLASSLGGIVPACSSIMRSADAVVSGPSAVEDGSSAIVTAMIAPTTGLTLDAGATVDAFVLRAFRTSCSCCGTAPPSASNVPRRLALVGQHGCGATVPLRRRWYAA